MKGWRAKADQTSVRTTQKEARLVGSYMMSTEGGPESPANGSEMETKKDSMKGTAKDEQEMERLGRTQQLNRNFRFISILGFSSTAMSTWEIVLSYVLFAPL